MRRASWVTSAAVASLLWLVVASAAAQGPFRNRSERTISNGPQRMQPVERREAQQDMRDTILPRQDQRLSPDERRQLRRDVHEAGRDLYRERMRSGRRPRHE